ncbi:MAG: thiaminase II [Mangrovibacterium sp.]
MQNKNNNTCWSKKAWQYSEDIYQQITQLDFIKELTRGTLPKEKFQFYIAQDALYLKEYGAILAEIATRLSKAEHQAAFANFASSTVSVEQVLHAQYIDLFSQQKEASPSNLLYTSFLWAQLAKGDIHQIVAAVLPCFWIYKEVGDYILAQKQVPDNPYQDWINTYGGEEFANSVRCTISICNEVAAQCSEKQQEEMLDAYRCCCKMEWLFWQSAYEQEKWRV